MKFRDIGFLLGNNTPKQIIPKVEWPMDVSLTKNEFYFKRWKYPSYNTTIAAFWTPYLVRSNMVDSIGPTHNGLFSLYLDEFDEKWTTQIEDFDYLIINAGHWFFQPMIYYEQQNIVGCCDCLSKNVTDLTVYYGYRKVFRTAFKAINSLQHFKGVTFLRTFAPSHFENGTWDQGGHCVRTRPFRSSETQLKGTHLKLYMIQLEEFKLAEKEGRKKGLKFRLFDITQTMLLRPDGHPSKYGHWPYEKVTLYNDCVHWCLPGPIDAWNDFLLELLKMEHMNSTNGGEASFANKLTNS